MSPILLHVLPVLSICRSFPRLVVFAPCSFVGLGIKHLYTLQEITRLNELILHTSQNPNTGTLNRILLELLHIEMGSPAVLSLEDYPFYFPLATDSNVKSTMEFLILHGFSLTMDIKVQFQQKNDCFIMEALRPFVDSPAHFELINKCRLYLRAMLLSDIADGSGTVFLDEAWVPHSFSPSTY